MKYRFLIIGLLMLILLSCGTSEAESGTSATVELDGNPTTGYIWNYKIEDESAFECKSADYKSNASLPGIVGVGGKFTFVFVPLKNNAETHVFFTYARSWETDVEPLVTKTVIIRSDENGYVTVEVENAAD